MMRSLAFFIACGVGISARAVDAQTVASYRARVDSIAAELRRKEGEQAVRDSVARTQLPRDTVHAGVFTILTDSTIADVVRRSAARASARIEQLVDTRTALDTVLFAAIPTRDSTSHDANTLVLARVDRRGVLDLQSSQYLDEPTLANVWEGQAGVVLSGAAGVEVATWLKGAMPVGDREDEWRDARVELVTARAKIARGCFRGDAKSCAAALALVPTETPLVDWYDRAERRDFIRRHPYIVRREQNVARFDACVRRSDDQACDALAREAAPNVIDAPLGQASRRSLVLMALQMGGPRAYERLVHTHGTIEARVSAAAGVPPDSLIRAWHGRVTNAPGADGPLSTSTAVASMCWVTLCALLALRSSRWR